MMMKFSEPSCKVAVTLVRSKEADKQRIEYVEQRRSEGSTCSAIVREALDLLIEKSKGEKLE